ncbi:MAG: GTP cyclohydrolase FolE2 [Burkholderiaceae bacterium]|nr:GTP cyclohydrolase I FolE2 [Burkholderiaceae bacterium]
MNAPDPLLPLFDVQSQRDDRQIAIDAVGVHGLRHPLTIQSGTVLLPTIATVTMTVGLGAHLRGTHMSRFVELLEAQSDPVDQRRFGTMVQAMVNRLEADSGAIDLRFPWFVIKHAPVSGARSRLDHEVRWHGRLHEGRYTFRMGVRVPVTSLCPCSRAISDYGAHNQRSIVSIEAELAAQTPIDELVAIAERNASCEIYGLLKRGDEKYVTERAYDNPRFVEDLVRNVAADLDRDSRVVRYRVEAENFESIHNHSAFARVVRDRLRETRTQGTPS